VTVADAYLRKSTLDDGRSIAGQEEDFYEDCEEEGLTVGRLFADSDRSASRYARRERPNYEALLAHVQSGHCQMISMWDASRGGRNLAPWAAFLDLCREKGTLIRVITHKRTYDIGNRRDWKTLAEDGVNAADESEVRSEQVRRGKRYAAKKGRPVGRLAYGWKRVYDERRKFVEQIPHPEQAPIVCEIVERIAKGETTGSIAKDLNARGVAVPQRPCPVGCERDHRHFPANMTWTDSQVRMIAIRPAYAGDRVHQGDVIGKGLWKPLVDPDLWAKAHAILTSPKRHIVIDTRLAHWLTGAVFCELCHGRLQSTGAARVSRYICRECRRSSASTRGMEGFLEPILLARFEREDSAKLFAAPNDDDGSSVRAAEDLLGRLEQRLEEYRAEGRKLDGLSAAAVAEAERGLLPQIEAARRKLKQLRVPPALEGIDIEHIARDWHGFGPLVRRELVLKVAHIVLAPGTKDGRKTFDPWRLAGSRWTGDDRTWGEIWAAAE
jgi:site-specific DNA recombinase